MKKVLSVLLAVCMIFSMMSALTVQAENKVEIIMDEAGVDEAVGTIASTGGIGTGWKEATHDGFYGGTAMRAAFTNTTYTYTFQPKVDAGWYDVYTYYGWTLVEDGPTAWGAGTWTLDNGLGAEGNKAKVSVNVNDGLAKSNYAMEDGWYKLGTVYFGGTHTKDIVSFKQTANRPYVDAIKIVTSDYDPDTIIMEQDCTNEALGKVTSSGGIGVGWTVTNNAAFSGGTAYRSVNDSNYHVTFWPKVDAGWYDVYTYYGWTETVSAWGAGTWKLDNGLGETGKKAPVSLWVNDGHAQSKYSLEDGWYKIGTVYFSGVYEQDYVQFTRGADMPYVDAIKIKTSDYDPDTIIMDETGVDESIGKVTNTGAVGVGWNTVSNSNYYGGSALQHANFENRYTYTFMPKLSEGWYDVYIYKNWTCWGSGIWSIDNGLGETGAKAPISQSMNLGKGEDTYPTQDGWYKLGTAFFSGVFEKDTVTFTKTANMPVVDAIKITKSDYQPAPEPEPEPEPDTDPNSLILDEINLNEAYGSISKSGTWNTVTSDSYYGGNALKSPSSSGGKFTFYPKVDAGWYDVFMYKNWKGWGEGTWTIDNGLNESGDKASVSINMNVGKGEDAYPTQDGWYKLATVYFSGIYQQDSIHLVELANEYVVDAIKLTKLQYDPDNIIMDEAETAVMNGSVSKSGSWETTENEQYYGGSALIIPNNYSGTVTYYPKVDAGWYDVYMYKNWTGWGAGTWTVDNGLGETGAKTAISAYMNIGKGEETYPTEDGWFQMGTVYFSGVYKQDKVSFKASANRYVVDAIRIEKKTYDPCNLILDDENDNAEIGSVSKTGAWKVVAGEQYIGQSAQTISEDSQGSITYYPKLSTGWYDVYLSTKPGNGICTIDNGLNASDIKASVQKSTNTLPDGVDGWNRVGRFYFNGTYMQDKVILETTNGTFTADAVRFEKFYDSHDITFYNESGKETSLTSGTLTAKIDTSAVLDASVMIVAIYRMDGALYRTTSGNVVPGGTTEILLENLVMDAPENYTCKYFIWDTVSSMKPITERAGISNLVTSFIGDAETSRGFAWTANSKNQDMVIRYAPSLDDWTKSYAEVPAEKVAYGGKLYYKADITDLEPATEYTYVVGDINDQVWSESYTFTTENAEEKAFSFITVTDTQGSEQSTYDLYKQLIDTAMETSPSAKFMLSLGDMVETGYSETEWNMYFDAIGDYTTSLPHMAIIGNHETRDNEKTSANEAGLHFGLHLNFPEEAATSIRNHVTAKDLVSVYGKGVLEHIEGTVYSFDYGDVHFAALNSGSDWSASKDSIKLLEAQSEWLRNDLESSDAKWKIVMIHQGLYPAKDSRYFGSRDVLEDIFTEYGVNLVLQGHDHMVARTYPMADGAIVSSDTPEAVKKGEGVVYYIPGSAGDKRYSSLSEDKIPTYLATLLNPEEAQPTYSVIDVTNDQLTIKTYQLDNTLVDSFTITE